MEQSSIRSNFVLANGLRLHYLEQAPIDESLTEAPIIVFLHGFPEHAGVWRSQLAFFSKTHRAIALDLPGYNLSQAPDSLAEYSVPNLVSIIAEFIRVVADNHPVILVAHDWGGAIAWPLAARHPQLITKLVILNAAHPSTFTREMINNPQQRILSDYIHDFLNPNFEDELSQDDFAKLKQHSIAHIRGGISAAEERAFVEAWSKSNAVTHMLNYYRAMPQLFPRSSELGNQSGPIKSFDDFKIPHIRIDVPTLVLWGEDDQAFDIGVLAGLNRYIPDYTEQRFGETSHWIHHERSDEINVAIAAFINR